MKLEVVTTWLSSASVLASCVAMLLVYLVTPTAHDRAVKHLPGPDEDLPILRNTREIIKAQKSGKFHDWLLKYCRKYQGKPWRIRGFGKEPSIVVSCPEAFENIQKTQFEAFDKSPNVSEAMYDVLGQGIFAISGPLWQHQRKTASHLFTAQMLQYAMEVVVPEKGEHLIQRLDAVSLKEREEDRVVSMKRLLDLYTMDIFAKVGFDVDLNGVKFDQNADVLESLDRMSVRMLQRIRQPMWYWKLLRWLNVGAEKQLAKDVRTLDELVYGVMSRSIEDKNRRGAGESFRKDLISLFIDKSEVEYTKGVHTKKDLKLMRDFVISFLAAGRETTATAMSWVILMMNRYPAVMARVRQELNEKLPGLATGELQAPKMEDLQKLAFLEATIRETLRLFPVVAISGRSATRDVYLYEGTLIKAGTRVFMPNYAMGRMATVWGPDAEEFNPDRWLDPTTGKVKAVSPFKFSVFLGGPRVCIGMKFAMAEIKLSLAKILSQFDLKTVKDPFDYTYNSSITLQIKGPLNVVVSRLPQL